MREVFKTAREFNKKFPLKIYTCPICGEITNDPHKCGKCYAQSNSFFYGERMYEYEIAETGETDKIFPPANAETKEAS